MRNAIQTISQSNALYPASLGRAHPQIKTLFVQSNMWSDLLQRPRVAIVGSRKMSVYGRAVTQKIAAELAQQGVVIISGLAYGVDICAHQAALNAGGQTIAVLPSSIEHIYPSSHAQIAKKMVEQGGALVTEYDSAAQVFQSNFIARNRIVAALSQVILVTEGALKSGTLHTARFALEQGIDVMAVPGNVTNITSEGTNNLLKSGAGVATCAGDVLNMLGLKPVDRKAVPKSSDPAEQALIHVLAAGTCDGAQLQQQSGLDVQKYNQALTMLEITGVVVALGGDMWQLA